MQPLDIILLRTQYSSNAVFSDTHLIKPSEFLFQLHLVDNDFDQVRRLLNKIKTASEKKSLTRTSEFDRFLSEQYESVEVAEKRFFGSVKSFEYDCYKAIMH